MKAKGRIMLEIHSVYKHPVVFKDRILEIESMDIQEAVEVIHPLRGKAYNVVRCWMSPICFGPPNLSLGGGTILREGKGYIDLLAGEGMLWRLSIVQHSVTTRYVWIIFEKIRNVTEEAREDK